MDELCRDLVKPIVDGPEPEPGLEVVDLTTDDGQDADDPDTPATQTVPTPAIPLVRRARSIQDQTANTTPSNVVPAVPVKAETVEVQVKTEDILLVPGTVPVKVEATDQENVHPPTPSIPNSFCSDIAPKIEEHSQPSPSCLPPQPWEYVVVARDEGHAPIEDLLNCLAVEELQPLAKSLKVKRAPKKVSRPQQWNSPLGLLTVVRKCQKYDIIKALLTTSSGQSTLSFFLSKARQKGKTRAALPPCRGRQVTRLREMAMDLLGGQFPG